MGPGPGLELMAFTFIASISVKTVHNESIKLGEKLAS
jgi:hypothetical protein